MRAITLRPARDAECKILDDICYRSKAHWGYDAAFMESVRDQIRVRPDAIRVGRVWVAVDTADRPLGVVEVDPIDDATADLTLLFVAPENLRRGIGRALYDKARALARQLGARELLIYSDPHAATFYASMGATRIGAEPTGYQGRLLPKFSAPIAPTPADGPTNVGIRRRTSPLKVGGAKSEVVATNALQSPPTFRGEGWVGGPQVKSFRTRTKTLAKAKALRREMTEAEKKLWSKLRHRQIAGALFRKQVPVGPYIADFCCLRALLIVEVDGGQHDASPRDEARDAWLTRNGYRVLRLWNNEVMGNIEGVLTVIAAALEARERD